MINKSVAMGDPISGKQKVATCNACHGGDGNSVIPSNPKLAGQHEKYLLKQLINIQSGEREIALMVGQVDHFSKQDLADIAAYILRNNYEFTEEKSFYEDMEMVMEILSYTGYTTLRYR